MHSLRLSLLACTLLGLASGAWAAAARVPAEPLPGPPDRHVLHVRFDPASGTLQGTDSLTTPWAKTLTVRLHDGLSFTATCAGRKLAGPGSAPREAESRELRIPRECADAAGLVTIEFQLEGKIHDPIEQEPSLHFVTGDRTSGIISPEGIFLAGGTFWYPQTGRMETYDFTADLPAGWSVASQGGRAEPLATPPLAEGLVRQRHVSDVPADGLALSAGPYVVTTRRHGDVELSTFFFKDDPARAKLFLDAAEIEIDRLAGMLGAYPYPKFDIVENFFTTGYGFPAYTLLGADVIAMGERALRPGYLDHEIAHVWLGNYVHVDASGGNWCEGLVSYLTNYLGAARAGDDEALNARRRVSQRYSVDVTPEKDIAPAAFVTKSDDASASVGYGKVSMIFHALRRQLGDDTFWKGLRIFVKDEAASRASWRDVESAFEAASGQQLDSFFAQWVGRAGLPELALENVAQAPEGSPLPRAVTGEIVQSGTPWTLNLDVELLLADGRRVVQSVPVTGARTRFELPADGSVSRVTLDPGFDVPRRIRAADLPATLSRTLIGDGKPTLVVHPTVSKAAADEGSPFTLRARSLKALAETAAGSGAVLVASDDVAEAEVRGSSILALGGLDENVITKRYMPIIRKALGVDVEQQGNFRAGDRRWRGEAQAILVSIPHPDRPGATITVFVPNGDAAIAEGRKLFYYGWDQWVAMDGGLAQQRGTTWPEESATSVILAPPAPPSTPAARIADTIARLSDARLEGRESGSAGSREASSLVGEAMVAAGLEPLAGRAYLDPFGFDLIDLPQQPVLKVDQDSGPVFLKVMPGHAWIKPPEDFNATPLGSSLSLGAMRVPARVPAPRGLVYVGKAPAPSFEGLDLTDAFGVILDAPGADGASGADETVRRVRGWLEEARRHEAKGLIVLRPGADWPAPPQLAAYATLTSPQTARKRERMTADGGHRAAERAAMIERTQSSDVGIHASLPLVFGGKELTAALEAEGAFTRGRRTWDGRDVDVRFNVVAERLSDRNVMALARGSVDGKPVAPGGPVVIVQAHHDAVGELADGRGCACALGGAAGVAVLVEVAHRLGARPAGADVLFVSTGGKEWGLQGSRHLAAAWGSGDPAVRAVVDLDAIGQAGQPLRMIGRSKWPELAATMERAAKAAAIPVTADGDLAGGRFESDQLPWSEKGIPAIALLQADMGVAGTGQDVASLADAATLARLADAVEAAVRELAR